MRRFQSPFNGKRYVLNTNTGEIHDLDNETDSCHIDCIKPEHIYATDIYDDALIYAVFNDVYSPNGCHYCIPSKDIG